MKRLTALLLALVTACACAGCSGDAAQTQTAELTETAGTGQSSAPSTEPDTEPDTETDNQKEVRSMQLIPDIKLETGMRLITQKDHADGDAIKTFGKHGFYGKKVNLATARWRLAQWDSGPDLSECIIEAGDSTITDGKWREFSYDPEENVMTFRLDTSAYYQGRPAVAGDYWPHLLIEQDTFGYADLDRDTREYYRCKSKSIVLSMDIRLGDYTETPIEGDWVRAAQFLLYFYVKGINSNDFCWFGIQLFDNRWDRNDNYIGYDGGKADASGAMIYSIGSKYLYGRNGLWKNGQPQPNGDWVHIEIDIRPYLDDMLSRGLADGYFKAKSIDKLCINGMNMGWETIGTFDHTMYVKNLALTSYPDGK